LILADALAFASTLGGDHELVSDLNVRGTVLADPERIGQVLRNLLSNAAKYSPPGTPIGLRTVRVLDDIRFEVANHGEGLDEIEQVRIFEKFARGRTALDYDRGGLGLGLYLSRRILRAHGSELTVRSAPGEGAVFMFLLRLTQ